MRTVADCVPFGNQIRGTDSSATLFAYNPNGNLIKETDPEGKETVYPCDLDGKLVTTVDGNEWKYGQRQNYKIPFAVH